MEEGHLIEPVGLLAKTVEALFLVLCAFALTRGLAPRGRWGVFVATVAALMVLPVAALALAPDEAEQGSSASGGVSGEKQAAHSEAYCRLVKYVAEENMDQQNANAFVKLLRDMIRTMESPSWSAGSLRNAALDHLGVPRYPECE